MKQSEKIDQLAAALSALQGKVQDVEKDSKNTFFKTPDGKPSGYASLAAVLQAVRPLLAEHGLALCQMPNTVEGKPVLSTMLVHKSGQYLQADAPLLIDKANSQGWGSALSYARRFSASAILGVAQVDDDGNEASQAPAKAAPRPAIAPKPSVTPKAPVVSPEQRKAIFETTSVQMGMGEDGAIAWMKQITGKAHSTEWTAEDLVKIYAAIETWRP